MPAGPVQAMPPAQPAPPAESKPPEEEPKEEAAAPAKPVVGIIYPPPEVRNIVDKTASFVASQEERHVCPKEQPDPPWGQMDYP